MITEPEMQLKDALNKIERLKMTLKDGRVANERGLVRIVDLMAERDSVKQQVRMLAIQCEMHAQENGVLREKLEEHEIELPRPVPKAITRATKAEADLLFDGAGRPQSSEYYFDRRVQLQDKKKLLNDQLASVVSAIEVLDVDQNQKGK